MSKTVVSVRLEQELLDELDKLAGHRQTTRSKVVEKIIAKFFEHDRITQNALLGRKEATHA